MSALLPELKSSMCMFAHMLFLVQLFATLWTVGCQAPLSMRLSQQEFWSEVPFPSLGALPDLEMEPTTFMSPALAGGFFATSATL